MNSIARPVERPAHPRRRRIIFNDDGCSTSLYQFDMPPSIDDMRYPVDRILGTQVDTLVWSMYTGNLVLHDSKAVEIVGENYDGTPPDWLYRLQRNIRALIDAGLDPLHVLSARCRDKGIEFIPDLRVNDTHENSTSYGPFIRSRFKRAHPELLIGDENWGFDYAHRQVHEYRLALVEEVCRNYDVDGFHLDFCRGPEYFKPGEAERNVDRMSDFVERCSTLVRSIGQEKGRESVFAVRVPTSVEGCRRLGLDVARWVQAKLVDFIAVQSRLYTTMNMEIEKFVSLASGRCQVYAGIERVDSYGAMTAEMFRAAAAVYWRQGADGMYLFNFDCHGDEPFTPYERAMLTEIGDPDYLRRQDKHYFVSRARTVEEKQRFVDSGDPPVDLPAELREGQTIEMDMQVADDLEAEARRIRSVTLWVCVQRCLVDEDALEVRVNGGDPLVPTDVEKVQYGRGYWLEFSQGRTPVFTSGENTVSVSLAHRSEHLDEPLVVSDVELTVEYAHRKTSRAYGRHPAWYRRPTNNSAFCVRERFTGPG